MKRVIDVKRSGKFYRNNEREVMKLLGLEPTPNSGSGWLVKEDGQNENVICQLKSTDNNSIKINKLDLDKLSYNSLVAHKLPVFAIQFLNSNEVFLVIKPEDITDIAKYINTGEKPKIELDFINIPDTKQNRIQKDVRVIKSSSNSRKAFMNENDDKFRKKSKSAT